VKNKYKRKTLQHPEHYLNIILPSTPGSTKCSLSLRFPKQYQLQYTCTCAMFAAWSTYLRKLPLDKAKKKTFFHRFRITNKYTSFQEYHPYWFLDTATHTLRPIRCFGVNIYVDYAYMEINHIFCNRQHWIC